MRRTPALVVAAVAVVVAVSAAGCSRSHPSAAVTDENSFKLSDAARPIDMDRHGIPSVVSLAPDEVHRVVVDASGETVAMVRSQGRWLPEGATTTASTTHMALAEYDLFPIRAARRLAVDPSVAAYGVTEPALDVRIDSEAGRRFHLRIGAPTFNGAGFYAALDGVPGVFVLAKSTFVQLVELFPDRVAQAKPFLKTYEELTGGGLNAKPVRTNPWLEQSLQTQNDPAPTGGSQP